MVYEVTDGKRAERIDAPNPTTAINRFLLHYRGDRRYVQADETDTSADVVLVKCGRVVSAVLA